MATVSSGRARQRACLAERRTFFLSPGVKVDMVIARFSMGMACASDCCGTTTLAKLDNN